MTWPVNEVRVPLADLLAQATRDLEVALREAKLTAGAPFEWTMQTKRRTLWLTCDVPLAEREAHRPRPCGTHAAFVRHKANNEQPCEPCVLAEREYQRLRHLRRRERAA